MTPKRYLKLKDTLNKRQTSLTVIMENVHKPHNFSAIIRSCEAIGVHTAHAIYPESTGISQHAGTTVGAHKWVNIETHRTINEPVTRLKQRGFQILTAHLDESAIDFRQIDYTAPTAIIMGSELDGISDHAASIADHSVMIPMQGLTESLNVSVATAIILFEAQRQRMEAGMYESPELSPERHKQLLFEWSYPDIAKYCQKQNLPYPQLNDEGDLPKNPFNK